MINDKREFTAITLSTLGLCIAFYAACHVYPLGFIGHVWSMFP